MRFGVVRFPGSCDDVDARLRPRRVGEAVLLWHGDRDLQGVDAVVVPGGFSYGDYLRVGAIARFAPVMEAVIAFARDGGPVLGICNGFQVLCEAGLLPGRAAAQHATCAFVCRQVDVEVVNADTAFTRACDAGRAPLDPGQAHDRPLLRADDARSAEASGQVVLRYAPGENPNGSQRDIAGVCNEARQRHRASCRTPSTRSTSCAAAAPTG